MSNMNAKMIDISDVSWTDFASEGSEEWEMMLLKKPGIKLLDNDQEEENSLHEGIDKKGDAFYLTKNGVSEGIPSDEAFIKGTDIICKMARLGVRLDQDDGAFEDEMMRIIRVIYPVMDEISESVLYSAFRTNMETIMKCKNAFAYNHVMQDMCDFSAELYERGEPKAYEDMYWFCKGSMLDLFKRQKEYYEAVVDGFFISQNCDESVPDSFYDRSYVTEENQDYPNIYYLKITDYYAEKLIATLEQGKAVDDISEHREYHELYLEFLKAATTEDEPSRVKHLKKIYGKSLRRRKHRIFSILKREYRCLPIACACAELFEADNNGIFTRD